MDFIYMSKGQIIKTSINSTKTLELDTLYEIGKDGLTLEIANDLIDKGFAIDWNDIP